MVRTGACADSIQILIEGADGLLRRTGIVHDHDDRLLILFRERCVTGIAIQPLANLESVFTPS